MLLYKHNKRKEKRPMSKIPGTYSLDTEIIMWLKEKAEREERPVSWIVNKILKEKMTNVNQ